MPCQNTMLSSSSSADKYCTVPVCTVQTGTVCTVQTGTVCTVQTGTVCWVVYCSYVIEASKMF